MKPWSFEEVTLSTAPTCCPDTNAIIIIIFKIALSTILSPLSEESPGMFSNTQYKTAPQGAVKILLLLAATSPQDFFNKLCLIKPYTIIKNHSHPGHSILVPPPDMSACTKGWFILLSKHTSEALGRLEEHYGERDQRVHDVRRWKCSRRSCVVHQC